MPLMEKATSTLWDNVIVGGGITGTMTAVELVKRGESVLIIDKDGIGFEASSRNMGAIGALGKFAPELAVPSADAWSALAETLGQDIELKRAGRLIAAYGDEDLRRLDIMHTRLAASDARLEWVEKAQAHARFPELGPKVTRLLFSPDDGTVNPMKVMAAVKDLIARVGVEVLAGTRVHRILTENGRVSGVETEIGKVRARKVLVACGIWSDSLMATVGYGLPLQLITVLHAETKPLPHMFDYFLRTPVCAMRQFASGAVRVSGGYRLSQMGHPLSPRDLRFMNFWLPRGIQQLKNVNFTRDMRLIGAETARFFGAKSYPPKDFNIRIPLHLAMRNILQARKMVPAMAECEFDAIKGGLVDATPDALPVVGPLAAVPGLFVAAGFTGQGFGLGPVTGRVMAELMTGETPHVNISRFAPERFKAGKVAAFPGIG